jgi:hypothetical protein
MSRYITQFSILALTLCTTASAADLHSARPLKQFPPGLLRNHNELPPGRLKDKITNLPAPARDRAVAWLRGFHFTELDLAALHADDEGGIYYVDHFEGVAPLAEESVVDSSAAVPVSPFASGLKFHSRKGAPNVIYLDFDGETVTGTQWNSQLGRTLIQARPFSADSDYTSYSDAEQAAIKRIWQRVAEDYAPFNVDVTTERPNMFTTRTAHVLITPNTDAAGLANPSSTGGGVAYVNVFASSSFAKYRPAWVYSNNLSNREDYIAEAASHEAGHNFGLSHDGTSSASYYGGHGAGETSWGPIMGTGYGRNVSQWCKGEYYLANNTQDDLAIISGKAPYIADDHSALYTTATALQVSKTGLVTSTTPETDPGYTKPANKGIIERAGDVDTFFFVAGAGALSLSVKPWISPVSTRGGNTDLVVELLNSSGKVLLVNNGATTTAGAIATNVQAGNYYLRISSTGTGSPFTSTPGGYTAYGSLGQYFISGTVPVYAPAPQYTTAHPTPIEWLSANGFTNDFETAVVSVGANGYPVWQSYIAGLDPNDPSSKLLLSIRPDSSGTVLNWNTAPGRVYTLLQSANPSDGYTVLATDLPETVTSFTHANPGAGPVFYRLEVANP